METKIESVEALTINGKAIPITGKVVGYGAIISHYQLNLPFPNILSVVVKKGKKFTSEGWRVFPESYQPEETLYKQLVFALKYEGINLLVFSALFNKIAKSEVEHILNIEPNGQYSRKIWFLYEFLKQEDIEVAVDLSKRKYIPLLDTNLQYAVDGKEAAKQKIINNLPGTVNFCPLIFKTDQLEAKINATISEKKEILLSTIHKDVLQRASSFLLLKDSKASFTIENEIPSNNRAFRWGKAIGQAGGKDLSLEELERLQQIVIENSRFLQLGMRSEGGFIGEHDRSTGEPIPDHISAVAEDLEILISGVFEADKIMQDPSYDAVLAAASLAFGFVFIHPFVDGNGRLHRYIIHHILAKKGFTRQGVIFPVSASILDKIDDYRKVLQLYSHPLLNHIEWQETENHNVKVLNETIDFYRYFDATKQAEFLYDCVEDTLVRIIPQEVRYLQNFDEFKFFIDNKYEMPDKMVALLVQFLQQEKGKLSKRALKKEFCALEEFEIIDIENKFREIFIEE